MHRMMKACCAAGLLAFALPASAQIVNGNNGGNGSPEAPIGTKAGGSDASMQAPGETAAAAGATQNRIEQKTMQPATAQRVVRARTRRNTNASMSSPGSHD
jgi:hypothetical protein